MYHVLCWFIILFRLLSVIVTFYSEFQTVIIPVTVQNRTSVYMNFFDHKDLGYHLLQLRPKVVKHLVYVCLIATNVFHLGFGEMRGNPNSVRRFVFCSQSCLVRLSLFPLTAAVLNQQPWILFSTLPVNLGVSVKKTVRCHPRKL